MLCFSFILQRGRCKLLQLLFNILTKYRYKIILSLFEVIQGAYMRKGNLYSIFFVVFIDLLGFGLILPLLPFYAEEYGATPFVVGLLTASYAAALSDRFGRRPV